LHIRPDFPPIFSAKSNQKPFRGGRFDSDLFRAPKGDAKIKSEINQIAFWKI